MMHVSLIISNSNIKILAMKGRQVVKWGSVPLQTGQVRDGLIIEPEAVAQTIQELFKSTGIPREEIAVSLAGLAVTYRFLNLPRVKSDLLEEAILRTARKEMSVSLEELYLSWRQVPGKADELSFFVLGVSRNILDAAMKTFSLAGIEPYTLELQPLALARAANRRDAIAVSLEPDFFNIVFIADGIPQVIHTISPRGEGATLEDNIRRLADELTKTAAFYQSSHTESRLTAETPLLLTGELSAEPTAAALLQAEIEYPIESMSMPAEPPSGISPAVYTVNTGLALNYTSRKTMTRTKEGFYDINVNILTGKTRKSQHKPLRASQIWLAIILAAAVILLFPLYQSLNELKTENANLGNELRRVNLNLNMARRLANDAASAETKISTTINSTQMLKSANQSIIGDRGSFTRDLNIIATTRPPELTLTSVEINGSRINLRGETESVFTTIKYATALEAVPFPEVRITRLEEAPPRRTDTENPESITVIKSVILFEITINK